MSKTTIRFTSFPKTEPPPSFVSKITGVFQELECGLEVEAVRAIRGGAIYRDLVQAMVMVDVRHLCIAVPNYLKVGKTPDRTYLGVLKIVDALFGHSRLQVPYGLTIIGY